MTPSEIKMTLKQKGVDPHQRIKREKGGQYLVNLIFEFNNIVKNETKQKIIDGMKTIDISD